jgi:hypothetical protein
MTDDGSYWSNGCSRPDSILFFLRKMFLISYGDITKVISSSDVEVHLSVTDETVPESVNAKYISLTSALFELSVTPFEGDHVLILSPKKWAYDMFTGTKEMRGADGYSVHTCVAVGLGTVKGKSINTLTVDTGKITAVLGDSDNEVDISVSAAGKLTSEVTKETALTFDDKLSVKASKELDVDSDDTVVVQGGSNGAARKEDEIKSTSAEDPSFWGWFTAFKTALSGWTPVPEDGGAALKAVLTAFFAASSVPSSLTGKITGGSTKTKVG